MANWWDAAPLADNKPTAGANWWEAAPLAQEAKPATVERAVVPEGITRVTVGGPAQPDRGAIDAGARGVASGVTANFYDELRGLVEANGAKADDPASLYNLIGGAVKYWSGDKEAGKRYETAATRERDLTKAAEEQHPYASLAGNVAGAVALPIGAAANAATLPGRMAAGAGVGAAIGGVAGAGEGIGAADTISRGAMGAGVGGLVGAAAPAAIEGVIRGARAVSGPITNAVRGIRSTDDEAARRVALSVQRDMQADPAAASRLTPAEFAASAQSGGPATIMDLGGETTRALARSAANTSPEGRGALNRAINDRFEGQADRVTGWLRNTFHFPDAEAQREALEQVARTVNTPRYAQAYRDGSRGVWSDELQRLAGAPAIQEAARAASPSLANRGISEGFQAPRRNPFNVDRETGRVTLRETASGNQIVPDLRFWDQVKRSLDSKIGMANRAGDRPKVAELTALKNTMVQELDRAVPSYQQARAGASHFFGAQDALEAGRNFVGRNMSSAEARRALAGMSPQERQLFQDGFVSEFTESLSRIGDRRSVLNKIAEAPAAREKLNVALGRRRADELEAELRVEGIMDLARGAVQGNSTTARQLTELGLAGGVGLGSQGFDMGTIQPSALMNAALVYGAVRGRNRINENVSRRVADMLVSQDPQLLRRGIQVLTRNQTLFNSLRASDRGLARVGGEQAGAVPAIQSAGISRGDDQPNVPRPPGQ